MEIAHSLPWSAPQLLAADRVSVVMVTKEAQYVANLKVASAAALGKM